MSNGIQRRWGIVALAVAMYFVTLVVVDINGRKQSLYLLFWMWITVKAWQNDLIGIKKITAIFIVLNVVGLIAVFAAFDDYMMRIAFSSSATQQGIAIGILVMLIPKVGLWFYCDYASQRGNSNAASSLTKESDKEIKFFNDFPKSNAIKVEVSPAEVIPVRESNQLNIKSEAVNIFKDPKKQLHMEINEDLCWEKAFNEYDSEERNKGLWARLYVENDGVEEKIKIAYIKRRAEQILNAEKNKESEKLNLEKQKKAEEERNLRLPIEELFFEKRYDKGVAYGNTYLRFGNKMCGIKQGEGCLVYEDEGSVKEALKKFSEKNAYGINGFQMRIRGKTELADKEINGYVEMLEKNGYKYVGYSIDVESSDRWVFARSDVKHIKSKEDLTATAFSLS